MEDVERLGELSDDALVARALACASGVDDEGYWAVVRELHRRPTRRVFDEMVRLAGDAEPLARGVAADVLGQLGYHDGPPFVAETVSVLARLLDPGQPSLVLEAAIDAAGHLAAPQLVGHVLAHVRHADADVRFSVACALPALLGAEWVAPGADAVVGLMELTRDEDADVRDWATFGLGSQVMVDGDEVRRCLVARVEDPDDDTRAEAIVGLAVRRAPGAVALVRAALQAEVVSRLDVAAAAVLGDPALADPLAALARWWDVDGDLLAEARRRCRPGRVEETAAQVQEFLRAAETIGLRPVVACDLLDESGEPDVVVEGTRGSRAWSFRDLLARAGGSPSAAARAAKDQVDDAS